MNRFGCNLVSADAKASGVVEFSWIDRQKAGKRRLLQLLGMREYGLDLGIYGLGDKRTISDYKKLDD